MDGLNRQTASEGLPHAMPKPTPTTPEAPASASPARLNPMGCRRMLAAWVRATIDLHNHAAGVFISIPGYRWMPMDAHGYAWVPAHTHTHTQTYTHTLTHTHTHTHAHMHTHTHTHTHTQTHTHTHKQAELRGCKAEPPPRSMISGGRTASWLLCLAACSVTRSAAA